MEELKPCPFCGGKPTVWQIEEVGNWRVGCAHEDCQIYRLTIRHRPTKAEAITAWNTRPSPWIRIDVIPEKEKDSPFAGNFHMAPFTDFKCCTYASGMISPPVGFYDFRDKKWVVTGVSKSYKPSHYMPIPSIPEKG